MMCLLFPYYLSRNHSSRKRAGCLWKELPKYATRCIVLKGRVGRAKRFSAGDGRRYKLFLCLLPGLPGDRYQMPWKHRGAVIKFSGTTSDVKEQS